MAAQSTVRIDCPDCGAPAAAWSVAPNTTEPQPGSHEGCPAPAPTPPSVEVTGEDATVTVDSPNTDEAPAPDACPTCGAAGDEPCVTSGGNEASKPHAGRG